MGSFTLNAMNKRDRVKELEKEKVFVCWLWRMEGVIEERGVCRVLKFLSLLSGLHSFFLFISLFCSYHITYHIHFVSYFFFYISAEVRLKRESKFF